MFKFIAEIVTTTIAVSISFVIFIVFIILAGMLYTTYPTVINSIGISFIVLLVLWLVSVVFNIIYSLWNVVSENSKQRAINRKKVEVKADPQKRVIHFKSQKENIPSLSGRFNTKINVWLMTHPKTPKWLKRFAYYCEIYNQWIEKKIISSHTHKKT